MTMMQLSFMLVKFLLFLSSFSVQGSAGAYLPLPTAAPVLSHFKVGKLNLGLYRTRIAALAFSPSSTPTFFARNKDDKLAVQAPHFDEPHNLSPIDDLPTKGVTPTSLPRGHPIKGGKRGSAPPPSVSVHKIHHTRNKFSNKRPHHHLPPPAIWRGPSFSPFQSPIPSPKSLSSPAPMPSQMIPSSQFGMPSPSPAFSPLSTYLKTKKRSPPPSSVLTLPPPPPNQDCTSLSCTAPLTYSPPGSPCGCVWPIEVSLRLRITLYTFFPWVTELAKEIATTIALNRSQVRIMGANAANQQLDKTIVLINLLPQDEKFDAATAFSIYKKFWKRDVSINTSLFGNYEVLYVRYPGLPPSPPSFSSSAASIDDHGNSIDGREMKPLGVDVPRRKHDGRDRNMIVIIVVSSATAFVVFMGVLWLLLIKYGCCTCIPKENPHVVMPSHGKLLGATGSLALGSTASSTSMSRTSSILAYTGTAKIFSISEIERATDNFDPSRILGEGGFGLVYHGILDNGTKVAVKVLKREDQQGSREFLAEVEMLSRLHHRNLVKLIGICTEAHCRCLVYELVPNGSVESHLHGIDKEADPLDWSARMKIALGAARGLAYLHEDSSPRVIHRDFKSSNILLENDFTPKVSDFGLARAAQDEANKYVSTHVMGTFGYLAPEYAMTGHLLVKSDVYSFGVVLLELLTGRKPVDLSQPPGQENLVAWARPLLATKEGIEIFLDPALKPYASVDSVAKVAAIASMCVQPEVSHRPFMGEVVQALTLVCNEFDETIETMSRSLSREDFSIDIDSKQSRVSGELVEASRSVYKMSGYDTDLNAKIPLSATDLKNVSVPQESDSFGRQYNSAPLKMGRRRHFWQRLRFLPRGSRSEHGFS